MFTKAALIELHSRAHQSYFTLLEHVATLPSTSLQAPLENFGFPQIRKQLMHLAGAEKFWITMLKRGKYERAEHVSADDVEAMRQIFEETAQETRDYLNELPEERLNSPCELVFSDGKLVTTPALVICHVVTHGFHHKGQVVAMCRQLGHPAPDTDMDVGVG